ncbi:MAG: hypothetical protein A2X49_05790 [Lentisphaerae bacterium GWF2_52_8]|nr:MAG: hypothetical protein A2X49_05790 [Lentisphaerae bacterium GWF2_52_8]
MPEKKEILCVIGQLGNGGTERQLHYFLQLLDREKYSAAVVVTGSDKGVWKERIESLGIEIISLAGSNPLIKLLRFALITRKRRPAVVFSWSFFTNAFCLIWGTPFIGSMRNSLVHRSELSLLRTKLCQRPELIVANSSQLTEELVSYGVPRERIRLIFNIFEAMPLSSEEARAEVRKACNVPEDAIVVAGAGRNSSTKDFPFFVESFALAAAAEPRLHGLIIGSGGMAVKEDISRRGLAERISILGEVPDARALFPAADIFFLSSRDEGMPNVLLEAVAAGAAPLATDVGGVRDILGPSYPFMEESVLSSRNPEEAAAKLLKLAADSGFRERLSQSARSNLASFSPEQIMPAYMEALGFRE